MSDTWGEKPSGGDSGGRSSRGREKAEWRGGGVGDEKRWEEGQPRDGLYGGTKTLHESGEHGWGLGKKGSDREGVSPD